MNHHALVIGHADADGHLIAEQVRRNLALLDSFDVKVVVDPTRTKDHTAWMNLDAINEITQADYVFFVDLMFGPATYPQEAEALTRFVKARPEKRFFLIDHHPLPLHRLEIAHNLRVVYRQDVCECAIGPRSGMMVVAALCERQTAEVAKIKTPLHDTLAVGIRRAAAPGGILPGNKLLALLQADRWNELAQLGKDAAEYHRLPRGRRSPAVPQSKTLTDLDKVATQLLIGSGANPSSAMEEETAMSYDMDIENEQLSYDDSGKRELRKNATASPKDLGVIVTVLEVAALSLTNEPGKTFSFDQLMHEARDIGGKDLELDERDIKTVLKKASFLKKAGKEYHLR